MVKSSVYFVNGFIESGKTYFIKNILAQDYFKIPGKTLVIACEEGEEEYDETELSELNATVEYIEEEKDFTQKTIEALEKKHNPERIMIEFNGMWNRRGLDLSWCGEELVEMTIFDATTFRIYSENLRPILAEQVRNADVILFYKADLVRDQLPSFMRSLKALNNNVALIFRGAKGDIFLDPDESLPYDIKKNNLELNDVGFCVFCLDAMQRRSIYEGKNVKFSAQVHHMRDGDEFEFIAGRMVITCCQADMIFSGIICEYIKVRELENKSWIEAEGTVRIKKDKVLKQEIPVIVIRSLKQVEAPAEAEVSLI